MSDQNQKVRELYALVQKQKAEIKNAENECYVTDRMFRYAESGQSYDIGLVRHSNQIQQMAAFLVGKERDFKDAGKLLGVENEFKWFGATVEQWMNDFKIRVAKLEITSRREKLNQSEARLLAIADPSFLQELELDKIKAELGV